MAFIQAAAAHGSGNGKILSANNPVPERHIVIDVIRKAAPLIGLGAPVIATLDAMLSCLPPKRNHHTVFASNATLTFRRNGISDRTIRRHVADLQEAGLLSRHDSPNRKRYSRHNPHEGKALRFGFDLTPLFARLHTLAALAGQVIEEQEKIAYIRCKIRAIANDLLIKNPENEFANAAKKALRRKLSYADCSDLLTQSLALAPNPAYEANAPADQESSKSTLNMSGTDGQNVRHHQKSNKESIDRTPETLTPTQNDTTNPEPVTIPELLSACPDAMQFSLRPINTYSDVVAHARTLAPMIGIDTASYEAGHRKLGPVGTAITVWAMIQFHDRIKSVGAYFRALTSGTKSDGFDPATLIRRLANLQNRKYPDRTLSADNISAGADTGAGAIAGVTA